VKWLSDARISDTRGDCGPSPWPRQTGPRGGYSSTAWVATDARDGLSDATAWQSLSKVNGFASIPASVVNFKRGGTWPARHDFA